MSSRTPATPGGQRRGTWRRAAIFPDDDSDSHCFGVIDPYGDTVFNRLQMPLPLDDLERLDISSASDVGRRGLKRLEALARRCHESTHICLRFIGD
jgi:hypothetical protein